MCLRTEFVLSTEATVIGDNERLWQYLNIIYEKKYKKSFR